MSAFRTDVQISVTSDDSPDVKVFEPSDKKQLDNLLPSGIVIRYGLNTIPTASLDLSPKDLGLICDIEQWRRKALKIRVKSTNGCLTFRGLIDGLSLSQSVGDMRMQLILKHPFQLLTEINPTLLGYHSAGVDFTRRVSSLQMEVNGSEALVIRYAIGEEISIDMGEPLFDGIKAILKAIVQSQAKWERVQNSAGPSAAAPIEAAKAIAQRHLAVAEALIDQIDTSFVKTNLTLTDFYTLNFVLERICESRSNLYDVLLSLLDTVGCGLVIANNKAFIVPNSGFLKQSHVGTVRLRELSTVPNIWYPVQYNSVSFNDNGYRDISGVYVISDENNLQGVDGFYHDTETGGSGGIIGEVMPYVISFNNAALRASKVPETIKGLGDATRPNTPSDGTVGASTTEEAQHEAVVKTAETETTEQNAQVLKTNKETQATIDALYKFASEWAQLRYYQLKYTDRTGGVGLLFNPNCSPGAVGSVYLRAPGVYIDFFVTDVTHEIRMSTPDHGQATTSVGFNCGRMGSYESAPISAGLEGLDLFDGFNAAQSAKVAEAFVKNVQ